LLLNDSRRGAVGVRGGCRNPPGAAGVLFNYRRVRPQRASGRRCIIGGGGDVEMRIKIVATIGKEKVRYFDEVEKKAWEEPRRLTLDNLQ
jgi:hypothetical protein